MNALKQFGYMVVATTPVLYDSAFAAIGFEGKDDKSGKVNATLKGTDKWFTESLQAMIAFLTNFLYLVAVAFVLYGGFLMLTAGGEEDKVKKGKTILMQAALGLLVVFLASTFVTFVIDSLFGSAKAGT